MCWTHESWIYFHAFNKLFSAGFGFCFAMANMPYCSILFLLMKNLTLSSGSIIFIWLLFFFSFLFQPCDYYIRTESKFFPAICKNYLLHQQQFKILFENTFFALHVFGHCFVVFQYLIFFFLFFFFILLFNIRWMPLHRTASSLHLFYI